MKSFAQWLQDAGLENYAAAFARNEIDFSVVGTLTDEDPRELGLSLGARKKFLLTVAALAHPSRAVRIKHVRDAHLPTLAPSLRACHAREWIVVAFNA
jgi:hypothetical protein